MFGRRKSSDGFEWHKYVRTTIKLRREQRRQRILEARRAAAQQAGQAGVALAAGSRAAGAAAVDGARAGLGVAALAAQGLWNALDTVSTLAWEKLVVMARPAAAALERPNIGGPVALAGAIALGIGIGRYRGGSLDREGVIALVIGALLLFAAWPLLSSITGIRLPRLPSLGIHPRTGLVAVAVVAAAVGLAWMASSGKTGLGSLPNQLPLIGGAKPLEGRAEAVGGDLLRIGGTTVRLAGIEAPERQQSCGAGGRRYSCAEAARGALGRLVSGRAVACTLSGTDAAGRPLASCVRGTTDVNGELVRQGHAFAEGGLFASYTSLEREARNAKAGMWAAGEVERPAEFRAKVWEEAKRRAPDGCPIKGLVTGGARVYVLPWSPDYDRGRIQKARGERWFCSEREAEAAGFKPAVRG